MRAWLVMLTIVVGAAGCDGGWRPAASREADALWTVTRRCDQQIWTETTLERLRLQSDVAAFPPAPTRLDGALGNYGNARECNAGCRTRLAAIVASSAGTAKCEAAARLVQDTSLAGYDREPELKARGRVLVRWFLTSYWALIALVVVGAMVLGKLDFDDAYAIGGGCIAVYGLVRLLARVPSSFWFVLGGVVVFAVGIVAIAALRKTSARGLGVLELVLAFAAFVVGMVGLSSLHGSAAYAAAAVGLGAAILAGGHGLHTLQTAKPEAPVPAAATPAPTAPAAKPRRRKAKPKAGPDET